MRLEIRLTNSLEDSEYRLDVMIRDMSHLTAELKRAVNLGKLAGLCDLTEEEIEKLWVDIDKRKEP